MDTLLRVMSGFRQYESTLAKKEVEVKIETATDDDSIAPEDSASNDGVAERLIHVQEMDSMGTASNNLSREV